MLDTDGSFDGADVIECQGGLPVFEPLLADSNNLGGHGFMGFANQIDRGSGTRGLHS